MKQSPSTLNGVRNVDYEYELKEEELSSYDGDNTGEIRDNSGIKSEPRDEDEVD